MAAAGRRGKLQGRAGSSWQRKTSLNTKIKEKCVKILIGNDAMAVFSGVFLGSFPYLDRRREEVIVLVLPVVVEERRRLAEVCHDAVRDDDN